GHGLVPEAMRGVGWRDWERAAEDALAALAPARRVFAAGLSMGALLCLLLAARHPKQVAGLALVAPAMRFGGWTLALLRATRRVPWERLKPWVCKSTTDLSDPQALAGAPILPRFPSARLKDVWT